MAELGNLKPDAEWTDDCGGKKCYDASIVSIDTRYWPDNTAKSSIILAHSEGDITLAEQDFSGDSPADVQRQVEVWAKARFDEIVTLLAGHFKVTA